VVSTVLAPASVWSAFDPFVPPNAPWLHKVIKAGGPMAARLYMKLVKVLSDPWLIDIYELARSWAYGNRTSVIRRTVRAGS
jgi:hypothetical protein